MNGSTATDSCSVFLAIEIMPSNQRIFVVEDHATTARALKMFLETHGYDVTVAEDVASALRFAKKNTFDLLICDLSLPDGTGWDLMKKLSANGPIRGIAFTAFGSDEDIAQSKKAGFMHHLVKGSGTDELLGVIDQTLNAKPDQRNSRPTAAVTLAQRARIKP